MPTSDIKCARVVGTSDKSLAEALNSLKLNCGIDAKPYTNIKTLFDKEDIDILVIASPDGTHLDYLKAAAQANCHVFCEKPLWWPADGTCHRPGDAAQAAADLIKRFDDNRRTLFINLQWSHTLSSFHTLYPNASLSAKDIAQFEIQLSPESIGSRMVIDSAPHLLSMLYQLLGDGDILNAAARYDNAARDALTLTFNYHHERGDTVVTLELKRRPGQPRPASYSINGDRVERHVKMPDYLLSLTSRDQCIPIEDPLTQSVRAFVNAVRRQAPNRKNAIVSGMKHLCQLVCLCEGIEA